MTATPPAICGNPGPRIGSEGRPDCALLAGHDGRHRAHDSWGNVTWSRVLDPVTSDAPRPDLDEAERREVDRRDALEFSAADQPWEDDLYDLLAEYDRRGAALAERDAQVTELARKVRAWAEFGDQWRSEAVRQGKALADAQAEIARLRAAVDVHALAEEIHDAIVGAGGDCPDVDDGNDSMCEHVAERIVRALAAAPAPAEDEPRCCQKFTTGRHSPICQQRCQDCGGATDGPDACRCVEAAREQADPADGGGCTCTAECEGRDPMCPEQSAPADEEANRG